MHVFSSVRSWRLGWICSFWQALVPRELLPFLVLWDAVERCPRRWHLGFHEIGTYCLRIIIRPEIPLHCNSSGNQALLKTTQQPE